MTARSLLFRLALGMPLALLPALSAPVAQAADAVFVAPGLLHILPVGDVVGGSEVQMYLYAVDVEGAPITELKGRASASKGSAGSLEHIGGGLYRFSFEAPEVEELSRIEVEVKGKTPDRESYEAGQVVDVHPPVAASVDVVANPREIILGQGTDATLSLTLQGAGLPTSAADLVVSTTAGEVVSLTDMGGGRFTARYVPPSVNYPHLAVITVADRRDPATIFGHTVIPLLGKVEYPVSAEAGATVVLRIEDREFGPVQAGADGKAYVPITAPPGVSKATQVTVRGGESAQEPIDLRVPETNRMRIVPTFAGVPADTSVKVPVRVVVYTPTGEPDPNANVQLSVEGGGVITPALHEGGGVYRGTYTPAAGNTASTVEITAQLGDSTVHTQTMTLDIVPPRPASMELSSEPAVLPADGGDFKVFAKLRGPDGGGLGGRELVHYVVGADLISSRDLASGDYQANLRADDSPGVMLITAVRQAPTGNALRHLVVLPGRSRVTNDGRSVNALLVLSLDALGYPVPEVDVRLSLDGGDGNLPTEVTTDRHGMSQLVYTAGTAPTMVKVRASAAGLSAATAFVQAPSGDYPLLPTGGDPERVEIREAWTRAVRSLTLGEGASGAPVATASAPVERPAASGKVAVVNVANTSGAAVPGSSIKLAIDLRDESGLGVPGQQLNVAVPVGISGAVIDLGQGLYEVSYDVPEGFTGGQVTVFAGGVMGTLELEAGEAAKVTRVKTPRTPREPVERGDYPWLRAGAAYALSSYRYEQRPFTSNGPLLTDVLAVGGYEEASNALPQGFQLGARAWIPSLPYVGFDGHFRASFYGITTEAFAGQVAPDTLYDIDAMALARYPFETGAGQFHVGARAGLTFDDFILFRGDLDAGSIEYGTLLVPGLGLGAEVGAEVSDVFFIAGLTQGLAYFSAPYAFDVDVSLGYAFTDNTYVDLGFENRIRQLRVVGVDTGEEYGELSDSQMVFSLGLGYQL